MFLTLTKNLIPGGYYIGSFSPLEEDYKLIREQMPKFMFSIIYPLHFIFFRIIPKLPIFNTLYNFLTNRKGRFLSKAEVFGRLSYFGYKRNY